MAHRYEDMKDWAFQDESYLQLRHTRTKVWVKRNVNPTRIIAGLKAHVNMVGVIWWGGHYFELFEGYLNARTFSEFLHRAVAMRSAAWRRKTLLVDGASFHLTDDVRAWLDNHGLHYLQNSPRSRQS